MAIYSVGWASSAFTNNTPTADLVAGNKPFLLYEVSGTQNNAAGVNMGFGRPANDGSVVQSSPTLAVPEQYGVANGLTNVASTWTTAPTKPAVFMRQAFSVALGGCGVVWTFPRGCLCFPTKGVCLWGTIAPTNTFQMYAVLDE